MKRRRHRRKYTTYKSGGFKLKAASAVLAICISVAAGYVTATQLIGPALGIESKPVFFDFMDEKKQEKNDNKDSVKDKENQVVQDEINVQVESGFALQYGSFSSREGAQECADQLKKDGIEAQIIEKDNSFKVIGQIFDTKDEARNHKENVSESEDVFITEIP